MMIMMMMNSSRMCRYIKNHKQVAILKMFVFFFFNGLTANKDELSQLHTRQSAQLTAGVLMLSKLNDNFIFCVLERT